MTRFGRLTVLEDNGCTNVLCKCKCGTLKVLTRSNLVRGNTRSCGCLKSDRLRQRWKKHSASVGPSKGAVFGRLTVLRTDRQYVLCSCSCGTKKTFYKYDVLSGKTSSCGCLNKEVAAENMRRTSTKHGGWGSREWNLWHNMNRRCCDPNAMGYENYGGRGIQVCSRWAGKGTGFHNFLEDMGEVPSPQHSLDRIDPDGNYEPGNVKWSTSKEQARNRRNNRVITAFGRTQCLAAWAEEVGLSRSTVSLRLLKGWSPERALTRKTER